jgi:AraC family transcriptional regulator
LGKQFAVPRKEGEVKSLRDHKSPEFGAFLRGPSWRGLSSSGLGWKGVQIEEHTTEPGEYPQTVSEHHIIGMSCGPRSTGEYANEKGVYIPYTKWTGRFTLMPAGVIPAVRPHSRHDFILCGIDPVFVRDVGDEMDQLPEEKPRFQTELQDVNLHHLVKLLSAEAAQGGPLGRLYADHLAHALVMKFLLATKQEKLNNRHAASPLPRHLLQRVIERMNNLDVNSDLQSLAKETGYSRAHFMRMFQAATGQTPHDYILQLRLTRARDLLRERRNSMIDIAALCGFSSQSHMATVFRQMLGITPSQYRRAL